MSEIEIHQIKGKIIGGLIALTVRTFIIQIIATVTQIFLFAHFSPDDFGVLSIASASIAFISYFSDVGLAAALIQKKEKLSVQDLNTVFIIQLILVGSIVTIGCIMAPFLGNIYKLNAQGIFLIQALLISFFLSSLKTIPSVILERKLEFSAIVITQVVEKIVYSVSLISLAILRFGITSFAWAAIIQGIVGLLTIYFLAPWKITFTFSRNAAKHLLTFGIPFQTNSILALIKDNLITLMLGLILDKRELGYINVAKTSAEIHLRLIMDNVIRITFPVYSRLQENMDIFRKAIEKSLLFLALFIFPSTAFLILYVNPLIHIFPRYLKWEPALFSFYLFAFSSVWASFSSPIFNALSGLGKVRINLLLMVIWTVMTWILVPILTMSFGFNGMAIASFIISFTGFMPILFLKRYLKFNFFSSIYKPFFMTIAMVLPIIIILRFNSTLYSVLFSAILGGLIYVVLTWLWVKEEIKPFLPKFLKLNR